MISVLFVLSGALLLTAFLFPLALINLNVGSIAGILLSAVLILWGLFRKKAGKKLRRAAAWAFSCGFGLIFLLLGLMLWGSSRAPEKAPDTLAVLGCRVYSGGNPSLMLQERIRTAAKVLKENPELKCVCSGGQGKDEPISEAECIYRELVKAGIGEERLLMEDRSLDTRENLLFTRQLLEQEGLPLSVTVVTSDFHCYRGIRLAGAAGLSARSLPAHTAAYLKPTYYFRECFAILWMWVRGK